MVSIKTYQVHIKKQLPRIFGPINYGSRYYYTRYSTIFGTLEEYISISLL